MNKIQPKKFFTEITYYNSSPFSQNLGTSFFITAIVLDWGTLSHLQKFLEYIKIS
jgi:hypothetical protein